MNLSSLLSSMSVDTALPYRTVYLLSPTYHPVFMTSLLQSIQKKSGMSFVHGSLPERKEELEQQLSISFLGQEQWYWLGSLDVLSGKELTFWTNYISTYQGPHAIWCHTKESVPTAETTLVITLPEAVDYNQFVDISCQLFPSLTQQRCALLKKVFKDRTTIPLDAACVLMQYASILSVQQIPEFVSEWVDLLLVPDQSLFTLSTLFFSKDITPFLKLWGSLQQAYSVHFWITYWSEQLFRAHQYIAAKQAHDITSAKKYAYRLPFSFIQRDWKKYSTQELSAAHERLYQLDFQLKQGSDERFFDLWVYEFLA